ncbi:RNB domain-containing ribonuclease [Nocardioides salsibiostraticola]
MSSTRVVRVHRGEDEASASLAAVLRAGIERIQVEQELPQGFPPEVTAAAERAAASPRLPELDRTELEFVTIDPPSAMDLDQALHIERDGEREGGFVVHYAIADVAAFVAPGDRIDVEANQRGETYYGADSKVSLHPPAISEDAGSLLAGQVRPALLWTLRVDASGEGTDVHVERALVKSRAKLSYEDAQAAIDDGSASESLMLLREVGKLRMVREVERGAVSLPLPEQEIDIEGDHWSLEFRSQLPVEQWNAQISLLTGFAAASLMVGARVGLLRTLPPPDPRDVQRLHRTAKALGILWPEEVPYPEFIRGLDPENPKHAAMTVASTRLLRGSGYAGFNGELPAQPLHAALASEYAHVTAPLRRLVDRYAGEICVALCAGEPVPQWVLEAMPELPKTMQRSGQRAGAYERAILDLVEAGVLASRVGEEFEAVVLSVDHDDPRRGECMVDEPGIEGPVVSDRDLPVGTDVRVRLTVADVQARRVEFRLE